MRQSYLDKGPFGPSWRYRARVIVCGIREVTLQGVSNFLNGVLSLRGPEALINRGPHTPQLRPTRPNGQTWIQTAHSHPCGDTG